MRLVVVGLLARHAVGVVRRELALRPLLAKLFEGHPAAARRERIAGCAAETVDHGEGFGAEFGLRAHGGE
ncbi:MAG TPA: hypothetical protein VK745_03785 [Polyangiaceae bacterium]|nr:hypothetical protein [Polyangiaceae bacterium]